MAKEKRGLDELKRVSITISEETARELRAQAAKRGQTTGERVTDLVKQAEGK